MKKLTLREAYGLGGETLPDYARAADRKAAELESEAKALRAAAREVMRIEGKAARGIEPSERRDWPAWAEAERVLRKHDIKTPNPGLMSWKP